MVKCHLNNSRILENKIVSDQYLSYGKTLNVPTSHKHCYLPEDVSLNFVQLFKVTVKNCIITVYAAYL